MQDTYSAYPEARAHAYLMPLITEPGNQWLLTGIEVAHNQRGQGHARKLLQRVLADADQTQAVIHLSIDPDGTGLNRPQLAAWYQRHGFTWADQYGTGMTRIPKQPAAFRNT